MLTLTCVQVLTHSHVHSLMHTQTQALTHTHSCPQLRGPLRTGGKPHQGDRPGNGCERDLRVSHSSGSECFLQGEPPAPWESSKGIARTRAGQSETGLSGGALEKASRGLPFCTQSLPKPDQVYGHMSCVELGVQAPWGVRGSLWAIWTHVPPEAGGPRPCSAAPPAPQHQRRHNPHCVSA